MMLSEVCLRQLYAYYNLRFPEVAHSGADEVLTNKQSQVQESAERFRAFETRAKQLLRKADLQESSLHLLYAVFPALYRAASESYGTSTNHDQEIEQYVTNFLAGYKTSDLPHQLITIVIKTLEKRLFKQVTYNTPSLDIGIGDGFASNFILEPNKITIGSEPTLGGLQAAKRHARHEHYVGIDATCIPFQNETFNTVSLIHSIDHVKDRLDVLREVERVMKPGGTLVLSDASQFIEELMPMAQVYKLFEFEKLGADTFNNFLDFGGERVEFYSPEIYRQILGELGFEDVRVEYFMASQIAKLAYAQFELYMAVGGDGMARPKHRKLREFFFDSVKSTIVPLLSADRELCAKDGKGLNMFVTARKRGAAEEGSGGDVRILDHLACPQCKGKLAAKGETYACAACDLNYPVVDSIPLLIPFYAEGYAKIAEIRSDPNSLRANNGGKLSQVKRTLVKIPYLYRVYQLLKNSGRGV
jgi:ubiquinone/menaquinone biosynthesis C-methylase UbiE/uncharacterized protein YbaR (Trm112 family)